MAHAVTPSTAGDSDDDEKREPSRHAAAASKRLFQLVDMDADGFVSFHEYIFFTTLLGIPESKFRSALTPRPPLCCGIATKLRAIPAQFAPGLCVLSVFPSGLRCAVS